MMTKRMTAWTDLVSNTGNEVRSQEAWQYLAGTLAAIITVTHISVTFVPLSTRNVTVTFHTVREPVVAERTPVTTPASILLHTRTLTTHHVTLTRRWADTVARTWLQAQIKNDQHQHHHHLYFPIQTQNKNHKNSHTIGGLPEKPKHEVDRITRCGDMAIWNLT